MPKNTATGFFIALFGGAFCFGMVWHIFWMIFAGLAGIAITIVARAFNQSTDYYVKAAEVEKIETEYANRMAEARGSIGNGDVGTGSLSEAT